MIFSNIENDWILTTFPLFNPLRQHRLLFIVRPQCWNTVVWVVVRHLTIDALRGGLRIDIRLTVLHRECKSVIIDRCEVRRGCHVNLVKRCLLRLHWHGVVLLNMSDAARKAHSIRLGILCLLYISAGCLYHGHIGLIPAQINLSEVLWLSIDGASGTVSILGTRHMSA